MAKSFEVGLIGAGAVVETYHAPVLANQAGVRISWVCDIDAKKAEALARRFGASYSHSVAGLPDVDAVLVAIPVGARSEVLAAVFKRRWNALVEKPFATTVASHDDTIRQAREAGCHVSVGLMRRFFKQTVAARRLVRDGHFGPLRHIWAAEGGVARGLGRGGDWYQNDASSAGGGVLIETGSHLIDQSLYIVGAKSFENLEARMEAEGDLDLEALINAAVSIGGQSDRVAFHAVVSRLRDVYNGIVLCFDKATIRVGSACGEGLSLLDSNFKALGTLDVPVLAADQIYQAFDLEWRAFQAQCRGGEISAVDASQCRLGTAIIEAAYRAVRSEAVSR